MKHVWFVWITVFLMLNNIRYCARYAQGAEYYETLIGLNQVKPMTCKKPVVVAVVDSNIDIDHVDLRNFIWTNPGEVGRWTPTSALQVLCRNKACNHLDDDQNGYVDDLFGWDFVNNSNKMKPDGIDIHEHGTHIAGIIARVASPAKNCLKIMSLSYYNTKGVGFNNLGNTVEAFQYAVDNGADIINYSSGGDMPSGAEAAVIKAALSKRIMLVAAGGNDGSVSSWYPASYQYDNIIGVGSVNKHGELLPSSNYGPGVNIAAPGLMILSTVPNNSYRAMSGTSQATAMITGALVLLLSQETERGRLSPAQLKQRILTATIPLKSKAKPIGSGILFLPKLFK